MITAITDNDVETRRYRNRVEFKVYGNVLNFTKMRVDIETEWNLKEFVCGIFATLIVVDIETEWNLKEKGKGSYKPIGKCRYRNRVEFKGITASSRMARSRGRYRNRVEFKGHRNSFKRRSMSVDIETEWNLKLVDVAIPYIQMAGRYRNRVEFKESTY